MLQIRELAEKENIPVKFLEAILLELNRAGYLASKRGKGGGYFLKKPMNKITIGEIVRLIDGPLAPDLVRQRDGVQSVFVSRRGALRPAHC